MTIVCHLFNYCCITNPDVTLRFFRTEHNKAAAQATAFLHIESRNRAKGNDHSGLKVNRRVVRGISVCVCLSFWCLQEQRAPLLFVILDFLINKLFWNIQVFCKTILAHKFSAAPVDKLFMSTDVNAVQFFSAADTVFHYASTTLQRYTLESEGSNSVMHVPFFTITVSPVHTSCISRVLPVLSESPS